ncbi:predicted protein [Naegleria gruberi]|uniref:Predicted protein n=1 Tax=Naegleria gruberi TaxID=5762 RepID=D2W622_NAEGR|nr:uncharacterized protein NAEGRDRAFT_54893 [Naegleria gruberi]EFC35481.1 predicted protein [Naegleria gruberi]|eukprot:XP_002668225.1 predicted protein [Naegleria gruberi strain NEG-M]
MRSVTRLVDPDKVIAFDKVTKDCQDNKPELNILIKSLGELNTTTNPLFSWLKEKREPKNIIKDFNLLAKAIDMHKSNDIIYCAFVRFGGEVLRYIGTTTDEISKRWEFKYDNSHKVQIAAVHKRSVALKAKSKFKSEFYTQTRAFRYLIMGVVEPEDILVVYTHYSSEIFKTNLVAHLENNYNNKESKYIRESLNGAISMKDKTLKINEVAEHMLSTRLTLNSMKTIFYVQRRIMKNPPSYYKKFGNHIPHFSVRSNLVILFEILENLH